ncbi:hypothetical protein B447_10773 [Thauera sp. 27]|uniref:hypothetical protein n=1 Tax=Thauera sp. 27 TaxID=305700 RepID=UPI0002CFF01E|nr:hypothetical protein [Thauera sp. 27]ENO80944.1 hypothetical protein B447_10773 [Thauera sp. 27]
MNLEERVAAIEERAAKIEVLLQLQSLSITAALAAVGDEHRVLACLKGVAEQHDAHGLYATSLSDDQLHRVLAGIRGQIAELERRLHQPASPNTPA